MNIQEFYKHLESILEDNDIAINHLEHVLENGFNMVEAVSSAASKLTMMILDDGNKIVISKENLIYMRNDEIVREEKVGDIIRELVALDGKPERRAKLLLEERYQFYRAGFRKLLKIDEIVRNHIEAEYGPDQMVFKFISKESE